MGQSFALLQQSNVAHGVDLPRRENRLLRRLAAGSQHSIPRSSPIILHSRLCVTRALELGEREEMPSKLAAGPPRSTAGQNKPPILE